MHPNCNLFLKFTFIAAFQIRRSTRYDASTNRQENPMPIVVQEAVKRPNQSKDLYRLLRTLKRSDPAAASVTAPWASLRQKWLLHHMTKLNRYLGKILGVNRYLLSTYSLHVLT